VDQGGQKASPTKENEKGGQASFRLARLCTLKRLSLGGRATLLQKILDVFFGAKHFFAPHDSACE